MCSKRQDYTAVFQAPFKLLKMATSMGCKRWVALGKRAIRIIPFSEQNLLKWNDMCDVCPSIKSITGFWIPLSFNHLLNILQIYSKNVSIVIQPLSDRPIAQVSGTDKLNSLGILKYLKITMGGRNWPTALPPKRTVKHSFSSELTCLYTDLSPFAASTLFPFGFKKNAVSSILKIRWGSAKIFIIVFFKVGADFFKPIL